MQFRVARNLIGNQPLHRKPALIREQFRIRGMMAYPW
jgi:hypothetical protein